MNATCTIDGLGPLQLVCPHSVEELGDIVRRAAADGSALYPVGGQTHLALGNPPIKPGPAVDMRGLDRIIDFPARDMTVTVQVGITMTALSDILAQENLRLPIDVAQADRATLGGIIAANVSGPRRFGFGTLRDYVIGISAVNDEGREFKAGGRVVKNVAGYDLCKLLVGSLGTLGIITQATLKLRPRAEHHALMTLGCESAGLDALLAALHDSRTRPIAIELLNDPAARHVFSQAAQAAPDAPWTVLVGFEGNFDAVSFQVRQLASEIATRCRIVGHIDGTGQPIWDALTAAAAWTDGGTVFRANLLPSKTAAFCQAVDTEPRPLVCAHAGNGIVWGHWRAGLTLEAATAALQRWRGLAGQGGGSVIVPACPSVWKRALDVWGPPSDDVWLMRAVKAQLDPRGLFNPGRFVAGI